MGPTQAEAFEQIAIALTAVITDPATISPEDVIAIHCDAPDSELLMVDWLNAIIYEMATRHMLFSRYQVALDGTRLHGRVWGETVSREKHQPAVEAKGATYTELRLWQDDARRCS